MFIIKYLLVLIILCVARSLLVYGQEQSSDLTNWDTLEVFEDKVYVRIQSFKDSNQVSDYYGYVYPDSIRCKNKNLFRSKASYRRFYSLVKDGRYFNTSQNGKYVIGNFDNGKLLNIVYYDSTGISVSKADFYQGYRSQGTPMEHGTERFVALKGSSKPWLIRKLKLLWYKFRNYI